MQKESTNICSEYRLIQTYFEWLQYLRGEKRWLSSISCELFHLSTQRIQAGPWHTIKMKFLIGFTALISLAIAVYGEVKVEDDNAEGPYVSV